MCLVHAVDTLLEVLEKDPAYTFFMLDGQTIVLDDYLEVRPENTERLQALVRQGRILVGPWYLQPDEFLVGGESLIRNLQVGFRMGQAYGGVMPVGYVPDTFGHLPQLPPIFLGVGQEECPELPLCGGAMRSSYYAHLLPGVLSSRMWLKQRNAAGEALLTAWAEPATAWAWLFGDDYPAAFMRLAWKHLLQNHPHDSICGCSIDTVHREMIPRFEQSEQIGEELTKRALDYLTERVDTRGPADAVPVVVFNLASGPRTDAIGLDAHPPSSPSH